MKNNKTSILVIEDDPGLSYVLKDFLILEGYHVDLAKDGKEGIKLLKEKLYDLSIIDIMLPYQDGYSIAQVLKKEKIGTPFIFLTAKSMQQDILKGLKMGADDYITKPFSMEELKLRIDIIIRRYVVNQQKETNKVHNIGQFKFNYPEHTLHKTNGAKIKITKKEAEVLNLLCINQNKVLKREYALQQIWGKNDYFYGRSMDVYISKLRNILKEDEAIQIKNIHGSGFKLEINNKKNES